MTERFEVTTSCEGRSTTRIRSARRAGTPQSRRLHGERAPPEKVVAGAPEHAATWFFETGKQGEGVNDIGTHLVDLVQWTLFPSRRSTRRRTSSWSRAALATLIRCPSSASDGVRFPRASSQRVRTTCSSIFCNSLVYVPAAGNNVKLSVIWDWEAPHGDTHFAYYRGSGARVEIRQARRKTLRPELYVVPASAWRSRRCSRRSREVAGLQSRFPGTAVTDLGGELRVDVPDALRVSHEEHFAQ